jgi:hypothetical protein
MSLWAEAKPKGNLEPKVRLRSFGRIPLKLATVWMKASVNFDLPSFGQVILSS